MPENMEETLEIERRFLIDIPLKWYGKFKVLTANKVKIYQNYLLEEGEENSRIRTLLYVNHGLVKVEHFYTTKTFISAGINKEKEKAISPQEYRQKLKLSDPKKHQIIKTRYFLKFDNLEFEFDVFEERLLGLAILEIELENLDKKILLPPYLKVVKEITDDKFYSNFNLASLNSYSESKTKFPRRID